MATLCSDTPCSAIFSPHALLFSCTAMCVNLCKAPCQTFFTEQLGMPLT